MTVERIFYRARQFWLAIGQAPHREDLELVRQVLTPRQMLLFESMTDGEQLHSVRVFKELHSQYIDDPLPEKRDLWVAALLHDVGKSRHRLSLWERVIIVLAGAIIPVRAKRWGAYDGDASGWRKPFIVAEQHAEWGARMAADAGASPLAVALIRRHQNFSALGSVGLEDRLLRDLQSIDDRK